MKIKEIPQTIFKFIRKYPRRTAVVTVIILAVIFFIFNLGKNGIEQITEESYRAVETIVVSDYSTNGITGVFVPTANGDSFVVKAEASGRVNHVSGKNQRVEQGNIIAELENSAQRSALIQAQGSYEAALANQGSSETSKETALSNGITAWKSSTITASQTIRSSLDNYFTNLRNTSGPSLYGINAGAYAPDINSKRADIEKIFDRWEMDSRSISESNVDSYLKSLSNDLMAISSLINYISSFVPSQQINSAYTEADQEDDITTLSTVGSTINSLTSSVNNAKTAITTSSGSGSSLASAQVKQALGSLESARSAYNKTIVKAPFSGTISTITVKVGDIITTGSNVAIIIPDSDVETAQSFSLPITSVKYTPAGAYVFTVNEDNTLQEVKVETGLVTSNTITVTGLTNSEVIVKDARGLKNGEQITRN